MQRIDITASRLTSAITELSRETGVSIGAEGALPNRLTPPLHGRMSVAAALRRLLSGTGYRARQVGGHAWRIERAPATPPLPAPPRRAQPAPDSAPPPVQTDDHPIIVNGLKRPSLLDSAPLDISVISLDPTAARDGSTGTAHVAALSEGLSLTALGPGRNRMFLRGVADSALNGESQSTVAVVLDGSRLTFSAPDPDLRLVDVDRVELLKGPQGSLYGSGALGGIYNIVARQPDLDETSLIATASIDAVSGGQVQPGATVIANLPLRDGVAALRVVGYSAQGPGWIDTGDRRNSNRSHVAGGRANLRVELGGGWQAGLGGLVQWLGTEDSQYVYRAGARSRPAQLAEPHDNDLQHVTFRLSGPSSVGEWTVQSGLTMHEVGDALDATVGADDFGLSQPQVMAQDRHYRVWDNELRLASRVGEAAWQIGLSYIVAHQSEFATLSNAMGQSLSLDEDHRRTHEAALFGDMSLPVGSDFSVDVGARLFRSTVVERRVIAGQFVRRDRHQSGVTPSVAVSWQPDRGHIAWLRYASAVRPGGSDIGPTGTLELLHGDELQSLEAGWRGNDMLGGRLELVAYQSRWSHIQSDMLQPDGLIETVNAGDGRMRGIEGKWTYSLGQGWQFTLGASYSDAHLVRTTLSFEIEDNNLPVVPRYTGRMGLKREFTVGPLAMSAGVTLRYVGPSHLSFDPAVDRHMGSVIESRAEWVMRSDAWLTALAIDNLFGGHSNSFAYGNPLRFHSMNQFTPQAPTTLTLTVSRQF